MDLIYLPIQIGFLVGSLIVVYFVTRKITYVRRDPAADCGSPWIVVLYPLLRESRETIRTTLVGHQQIEYPAGRWKMVAILNWHDHETIGHIQSLMGEFPFLDLIVMPPCDAPDWHGVWEAWDRNPHCYWWHQGKTRHGRMLPPKKTRQLIFAFYRIGEQMGNEPWIVNYIDADSVPPPDHFRLAVEGLRDQCDFVQATNVVGNLFDSLVSSLCAFDHMVWDGFVYPHMSSGHPYYCLGKGLYVRSTDVYDLGSWNPYITIEDPEFGLRFWKNGKRLGIIKSPIIEEVPTSLSGWFHQRNRWMCGFFQTLSRPLTSLGFTTREKLLARMNFAPTLSLLFNAINLPLSLPVLYESFMGQLRFAWWIVALSGIDVTLLVVFLVTFYVVAWRRVGYVQRHTGDRWMYLLRINPIFVLIYWTLWTLPILVGFAMFVGDRGKVWKRTDKFDANHDLIYDEVQLREGDRVQAAHATQVAHEVEATPMN